MLDIRIIREHPEQVRDSIAKRKLDPARVNLDRLLEVDGEWLARNSLVAIALEAEREEWDSVGLAFEALEAS